jgi:hypothetical protein
MGSERESVETSQLAGTWVFDPNGHLLSLVPLRLAGGRTGRTPASPSRRELRRHAEAKPEPFSDET